jgi:Ca-activated chloride channel homolog
MKPIQLFLLLLLAGDCLGAGIVILPEHHRRPMPPRPPVTRIVAPRNQAIQLHSQKITAQITDQIARTTIEQVFHNPNSRQLEGIFLFPVPKGAQLDVFTLEINGRRAEAELLDSGKAQGIYEGIVRSMKDPGLLEYADRDLYKIRIFPFPAHGDRTITVAYTQVLPADDGLIEYTAPLGVTKHAAQPPKQLSLEIELKTKAPLKSVWSATHEAKFVRQDKRATITYESANTRQDSDFQLYFASTKTAFDASLLTHRQAGEDGYFLLLLSPGNPTQETPAIAKDVTFVLDTSGSMAGNKLEQAKKALTFCVGNLNNNDRFEVLRFSTEVEPLFDGLQSATPANRKAATEFIRDLRPYGSTAIDDALKTALQNRGRKSKRTHVIIFLTDGRPTIGVTREEEIVANVSERNSALTRIFSFGIGTDVNTHLLDRITEKTRAVSQYVLPDEDLEVKLSSFFGKIKDPVLADVQLGFPKNVRTLKQYPKILPDLFKGDQLVLVGRYREQGKGRLTLRGSVEGKTLDHDFTLKFPRESARHGFIPRLWATRRVGYLLDEIRLQGENKELRDEVTSLARQYGIVTPYTAYLIVEDERRLDVSQSNRLLPQLGQDPAARRELTTFYRSLGSSKSGEAGVAGAKITSSLKNAQTSSSGRTRANVSAQRAIHSTPNPPAPRPNIQPGTARPSFRFRRPAPQSAVTISPAAAPKLKPAPRGGRPDAATTVSDRITEYTRQNRHIAGKTFYWNGKRWIDSAVRTLKDAKPIHIKFASDKYFALQTKSPSMAKWLALDKNLTLVLGQDLYEIHE